MRALLFNIDMGSMMPTILMEPRPIKLNLLGYIYIIFRLNLLSAN